MHSTKMKSATVLRLILLKIEREVIQQQAESEVWAEIPNRKQEMTSAAVQQLCQGERGRREEGRSRARS